MRFTQHITILLILAAMFAACNNGNNNNGELPSDIVNNPKSASGEENTKVIPAITFKDTEHDFGRVIEGEKITYAFRFTNTGKGNLVITSVSSSCGCTVPQYTKEPVKPGETGNIKVTFDSSSRRGFQHKSVSVVTNTQPNTTVLHIKAQVVEPEKF